METRDQAQQYVAEIDQAFVDWANANMALDTSMPTGDFTSDKGRSELHERFRTWFDQHNQLLKQKICVEWGYQHRQHDILDTAELVCAIAEVIEQSVVAPLAVSAILVRFYLNGLCKSQ